jgi:hypothetical protein
MVLALLFAAALPSSLRGACKEEERAMAQVRLEERVLALEQQVGTFATHDDIRMLGTQIAQLGDDMRAGFSSLRQEIRAGDEGTRGVLREEMHADSAETRRTLREDIRAGDKETRRSLREDIRAGDEETRRSLREDIRAGDEQTRLVLRQEIHAAVGGCKDELHAFIEQRTVDILEAVADGDADTRRELHGLREDVVGRITRLETAQDEFRGLLEQRTVQILRVVAEGDEETRRQTRLLHEDLVERISKLRG